MTLPFRKNQIGAIITIANSRPGANLWTGLPAVDIATISDMSSTIVEAENKNSNNNNNNIILYGALAALAIYLLVK